jgi:RNA polymerase sigma factor (sigma-70 family)
VGEESSIGSVESPPVVGSIAPVDAVAFEDFYRAHYPRIVRLLLASTGRIDLAEELAQDAFASAHRHWSKVSAYAEPGAWVRRVALNAATSAWRRRSNEGAAVKRLGSRRESNPLPAEDERVWAAVRRLPRRQAQVMMLIAIEDLSVAAVATCLAISENSVRTHIRRARETLARELGTDEEMEP